jgi:NTE family protein
MVPGDGRTIIPPEGVVGVAGKYEHHCDLVLQGGGVKGIGLVGALAVLEERGFQVQNLAGTSAGAIVATLSAAGYTAKELKKVIYSKSFGEFRDKGWEDRIPAAGLPLSILKDQGIYEGKEFLTWMRKLLADRGIHTFGDLVRKAPPSRSQSRYKVQVVASDLTGKRMLLLPRDARKLGVAPGDLEVALAVRMSMSIPFFFEPVRFPNADSGREHVIVDGGMLSNFPVWVFDVKGTPRWPTFGLMLVDPEPSRPVTDRLPAAERIRGPLGETLGFVKDLIATAIEGHDRTALEEADFVRTIAIANAGVSTTDFDLTDAKKDALYASGRKAARDFLKTWSFARYVRTFRSGRKPTRREMLVKAMR